MADNVTKLRRTGEIESGPSLGQLRQDALKTARTAKLILRAGTGLTGVWFILCIFYVHKYLGWDLAAQFLPHEIGMLVSGFALPLAMLWAGIGAFRRAYDIRFHTEMLRRHLDLLAYPAEEHESRVTMISDLLKKQADELSTASKYATENMTKLVDAMGHKQRA